MMNHSSDAEKLHSMVLLLRMRAKSTEELSAIWMENDRSTWKDEEIEAARTVLMERLGKVPEQKKKPEDQSTLRKEKSYADDWFWDSWGVTKPKAVLFGIGGAVFLLFSLIYIIVLALDSLFH